MEMSNSLGEEKINMQLLEKSNIIEIGKPYITYDGDEISYCADVCDGE